MILNGSFLGMMVSLLVLLLVSHTCSGAVESTTHCPPGLSREGGECVCELPAEELLFGGLVHCDNCTKTSYLIRGNCVTLDSKNNTTLVAGTCFVASYNIPNYQELYNVSGLDHVICGDTRKGTLCGQCKKEYRIDMNSYTFDCVRPENCIKLSWLYYLLSQFGFLNGFLLLVLILRPNLTSPKYASFLLITQIIALPVNIKTVSTRVTHTSHSGTYPITNTLGEVLLGLYQCWNLDFFTNFLPPFCLPQRMNTLPTITLQYVKAVYPLLLIVVVYLVMEYSDRCACCQRVLSLLWTPIDRCSHWINGRSQSSYRPSVVSVFATFLLLSYTKFVSTSVFLLLPVPLYNATGHIVRFVLFFDGTMDYLSLEHLPYAVLAVSVMVVFAGVPATVLLCFQFQAFQKCLEKCKLRRNSLVTFVELFQGHFRDPTDGGRDFRFVAGLYFIFCLVMIALRCLETVWYLTITLVYTVCVVIGAFFLSVKPYKQSKYNILDGAAFYYGAVTQIIYLQALSAKSFTTDKILAFVLFLLPAAYISVLVCKWFVCFLYHLLKHCTHYRRHSS